MDYEPGRLLVGFAVSTLGGALVLWYLVERVLWPRSKHPRPRFGTMPLGIIERALYTGALLVGAPGWIPVWLGLKVATHWPGWSNSESRVTYNIFLIGNALSVAIGFVGAWIAGGRLPSFGGS